MASYPSDSFWNQNLTPAHSDCTNSGNFVTSQVRYFPFQTPSHREATSSVHVLASDLENISLKDVLKGNKGVVIVGEATSSTAASDLTTKTAITEQSVEINGVKYVRADVEVKKAAGLTSRLEKAKRRMARSVEYSSTSTGVPFECPRDGVSSNVDFEKKVQYLAEMAVRSLLQDRVALPHFEPKNISATEPGTPPPLSHLETDGANLVAYDKQAYCQLSSVPIKVIVGPAPWEEQTIFYVHRNVLAASPVLELMLKSVGNTSPPCLNLIENSPCQFHRVLEFLYSGSYNWPTSDRSDLGFAEAYIAAATYELEEMKKVTLNGFRNQLPLKTFIYIAAEVYNANVADEKFRSFFRETAAERLREAVVCGYLGDGWPSVIRDFLKSCRGDIATDLANALLDSHVKMLKDGKADNQHIEETYQYDAALGEFRHQTQSAFVESVDEVAETEGGEREPAPAETHWRTWY